MPKIVINGNIIDAPEGANVSITKDGVTINGKDVTPSKYHDQKEIRVYIDAGVKINTLNTGGGRVEAYDVIGSINSGGGNIKCGEVGGSLNSGGGNVECGNVGGSLNSDGGDVNCGTVNGSTRTGGGNLRITQNKGNIDIS
jgi:hypothetical protein